MGGGVVKLGSKLVVRRSQLHSQGSARREHWDTEKREERTEDREKSEREEEKRRREKSKGGGLCGCK